MTRILTTRPLEKGAFFVGPDQALLEMGRVLSAPTSKVGFLNRNGHAAEPVFSRSCSCHVGAGSSVGGRLVAMLCGSSRR
ncbi:MAG: Uncharacterised protein [Cyanobium sp. ARS6]|nr:MAG: Uncharacterised protein [Cyanobium sp. ARS6]